MNMSMFGSIFQVAGGVLLAAGIFPQLSKSAFRDQRKWINASFLALMVLVAPIAFIIWRGLSALISSQPILSGVVALAATPLVLASSIFTNLRFPFHKKTKTPPDTFKINRTVPHRRPKPKHKNIYRGELVELIKKARNYETFCPVRGDEHEIPDPLTITGGQGRPLRAFGQCIHCGMEGVVYNEQFTMNNEQ